MKKMKKALSLLLSLILSFSVFTFTPAAQVSAEETSPYLHQETVQGSAILHCFNWSYNAIKAALPDIAAAGYTAVQTSPVQPPKDYRYQGVVYTDSSGQWWKLYQPLGIRVADGETWLGTKAELAALCAEAETYGIQVIVDIVANHLANNGSNGGNYSNLSTDADADMNNPDYYHYDADNRGVFEDNRWTITQLHLGMPDLNTGNSQVQQKVLALLKECVDLGVDGFRFDAAKHIEVPSDPNVGSQFWPVVIDGIKEYCEEKGKPEPFIYGEILGAPGQPVYGGDQLDIGEYTQFMAITDNETGNHARGNVSNGNAKALIDYIRADENNGDNLKPGLASVDRVLWAESHDTYMDGSTSGISDEVIVRTWAIIGSRVGSTSLFLARPNAEMGLESSDTTWKSTEVAEVNKFKNAFFGAPEYLYYNEYYNAAYNVRGTKGMVISKLSGGGYVELSTVENGIGHLEDGTYKDQVSGNNFIVENGVAKGTVASSGIAVLYNEDDPAIARAQGIDTIYFKPSSNWEEYSPRYAAYFFNNSYSTWVSMTKNGNQYECKIPAGVDWDKVIFVRMDPNTTENNWDNKWNQTADLLLPTGENQFNLYEGTWDGSTGYWTYFELDSCSGYSLSLEGDIAVNLYMKLPDWLVQDPNAAMRFSLPNGTTTTLPLSSAIQRQLNGETHYVFHCNVAAKYMVPTITARMVGSDNWTGNAYTCSIRQYGEVILAKASASAAYAKAAPVVRAMLQYGAYSQLYFNQSLDPVNDATSLANFSLDDRTLADFDVDELESECAAIERANLPTGTALYGTTLSLESKTTLSFYFTSDVDLTFRWLNPATGVVETLTKTTSGNYQIVRIEGIDAHKLGRGVKVWVDTPSVTDQYYVVSSPAYYIVRTLQDSNSADCLKNCVKALYWYWKEALAYKEGN